MTLLLRSLFLIGYIFGALLIDGGLQAGGKSTGVATCNKISGALLKKEGKEWLAVEEKATIQDGTLLVAIPKSEIVSKNGAVELLMLADIGNRGPYPVLESGVILKEAKEADLDVTFDRGLIAFTNLKEKGSAKITFRVRDKLWTLELLEPGTKVATELYSRHPPGLPTVIDGKIEDPYTSLALLVVEGRVRLDTAEKGFHLSAPPGPAILLWDNVTDSFSVETLAKLPEGIGEMTKDEEKLFESICTCACTLNTKKVGPVLDSYLKSDHEIKRLLAVVCCGAVDDLSRLAEALSNPKYPGVRRKAVLVLRHWMGREPGQVGKLYDFLIKQRGLSEVQAKSALQLIFGFSYQDRKRSETFDLLIHYLKHSKLPVRELAYWHLIRLAPEGRDIPYDAAAPQAQLERAYQQWRALIPEGKTPKNLKVETK